MHRKHGAALLGLVSVAAVTTALVTPVGSATAEPGSSRPAVSQSVTDSDHTPVGSDYNNGKPLKKSPALRKAMRQQNRAATQDAQVGDTVNWLALNDYTGQI